LVAVSSKAIITASTTTISPTDVSKFVARNDVIRITIQRDISMTSQPIVIDANNKLSAASDPKNAKKISTAATMTSLNGYGLDGITSATGISIDIKAGTLTIKNVASYSGAASTIGVTKDETNTGVISQRATLTGQVVYSISNAENLKAGDVITIKLVAGNASSAAKQNKESLRLQVGANSGQEIDLSISSMKAKDLGIVQLSTSCTEVTDGSTKGAALNVTTQAAASLAITAYDNALQKVSTERAHLGAIQNRLEHTISNLDTSEENLQASESRIRDVDMADEMTSYSKSNILQQAGTSMLAQANQSNQTVLSLLQ
jgi:flagellin